MDCLKPIIGGCGTPSNFAEETFLRMALKPRNPRKFSPSKISCYTVLADHKSPLTVDL